MNLPLTSLNNHTSNTFNRNLNDSNLMLSNRSAANAMLSPPPPPPPSALNASSSVSPAAAAAAAAAAVTGGSMPISNEHLYSTLYGRELELMRKIYKGGENRDHLVENPLIHSPHHQSHNPTDTLLMKNAGYAMNYPNAAAASQFGGSPYHHALSPSRTPPKVHHTEQILSPDTGRLIKQEEKSMHFNSSPNNYPGYGASSMSPTTILNNMTNPRKFDGDVMHKQMYDDRKLHAAFANKDHHHHLHHHQHDQNYGDNMYTDVMNASNNNNFMHLQQQQHEKQRQHHQSNTTKHNNNSQLIGTETNNHFYNISDYGDSTHPDKRQQQQQHHHSSHQLFQQNQFSINNTPKDNNSSGVNIATNEKKSINNTSKLNNACSHTSDSNNNNNSNNNSNSNSNNNNDNAKNVRMTSKFSAASHSHPNHENAFENPSCRTTSTTLSSSSSSVSASSSSSSTLITSTPKMCTKSIKNIDGNTSKINPSKMQTGNNATNLLSSPHSKCGNDTTNDFMLHIRVKEQKQQIQTTNNTNNNRMGQQMDFDETSNSCSNSGDDDAANYNDDEGDEFMNL